MKKKLLAILLVVAMAVTFAVPALAANNGNGNGNGNNKTETAPVNTFDFDVNNANFHCNDIVGENGRVWPDLTDFGVVDGKGNGGGNNKNKMAGTFSVDRIGDGTTWSLNDTVVCPECGSTVWVTFSNNSGVPNGNNVQFQHNGPTKFWLEINKTWQDYYGNKISAPEGADVRFTVRNSAGRIAREVDKMGEYGDYLRYVKAGKYLVNIADGPFSVKETVGFDGYTVVNDTVSGVNEKKSTAAFVNKEDFVEPILTIYKVWLDADGEEIEDEDEIAALNELVAFDGANVALGENVFDAEQNITFSEIVDEDEFDFVCVAGDGVEDEDINAVAIALKHKGVYEVTFTNQVADPGYNGIASITVYKIWDKAGEDLGLTDAQLNDLADLAITASYPEYAGLGELAIVSWYDDATATYTVSEAFSTSLEADGYKYTFEFVSVEVSGIFADKFEGDATASVTFEEASMANLATIVFTNKVTIEPIIVTPDPTDPIPEDEHLAQWWAKDGILILAFGANTRLDYFVAYDTSIYKSVTIGLGSNDVDIDYEVTFPGDELNQVSVAGDKFVEWLTQEYDVKGNGWINKVGLDVSEFDAYNFTVFKYDNPYAEAGGGGAKLIWLLDYELAD